MPHTSWCSDHNHPIDVGCSSDAAEVGDVGAWIYATPAAEPVIVLDSRPAGDGLSLDQARELARRLDELATAGEG